MKQNDTILMAILLGFLVSWIPRVAPFVFVKYKKLPPLVLRFLNYLPLSILASLTLSSLFHEKVGHLPIVDWWALLASLLTIYMAYRSKNLLYVVLTGVISMALLRFLQ